MELDRRSDEVLISVLDTGIGIPEDEVALIFQRFAQSSRTKTRAGGTGLGLAICREIVEAHGGNIWAENRASGGSAFHVALPTDARAREENGEDKRCPH